MIDEPAEMPLHPLPVIPPIFSTTSIHFSLILSSLFFLVLFFLILYYQQKTGPATTALFKHLLEMTSFSNTASISSKIQLPSKFEAPDLYFAFFSSNDREQRPAGGSEKESLLCSLDKDCTFNLHKLLRPKT